MCGIYGLFDPTRKLGTEDRRWAEHAEQMLKHRGPDGRTRVELLDERCLFGHLRLAIIDLPGGTQPISNEDGSVWVIFNGEIYNYVELREQLIRRGHTFRTHSDTEVLVHLYEEKGDALVDDIEGMYAFAILDSAAERLVLARDAFGEKPLYWSMIHEGRGIAFASEMKGLVALPGLDKQLDVAALSQFLALRYIPAPRTHLHGVRKLRAGELLTFEPNSAPKIRRFFRPTFAENSSSTPSQGELIESLRGKFREAVRIRLRSDVPVGAFLSGGIDSTLVASTVRELQPGYRLKTFCASFDDETLSEAPYARLVAERLETEHREVHFSSNELLEAFDSLIDHYDEPFADVSMFPTFAVCRAARAECKVMLSGDGGDELFGGYRNFFAYWRWHGLRRTSVVRSSMRGLSTVWPDGMRGAGLLLFLGCSDWDLLVPLQDYDTVSRSFLPEYRQEANQGLREMQESAREHARLRFPASSMEAMAEGYLPEQILVKVDRASMSSALECRTPFLDQSLFAFARGLPPGVNFARGLGKVLLREALPSWVPATIRWRQKQGFTPPLSQWLRSSLKSELEAAVEGSWFGLLDGEGPRQLFRQHQAGQDHSDRLFRWLVLSRRLQELSS